MKNLFVLFMSIVLLTAVESCKQKDSGAAGENTGTKEDSVELSEKGLIWEDVNLKFNVKDTPADTINKYYNIYAKLKGSQDFYPITLGQVNKVGRTKKDKDFVVQVWLSNKEDDEISESNRCPVPFTWLSYQACPSVTFKLNDCHADRDTEKLNFTGKIIIIDAGSPIVCPD